MSCTISTISLPKNPDEPIYLEVIHNLYDPHDSWHPLKAKLHSRYMLVITAKRLRRYDWIDLMKPNDINDILMYEGKIISEIEVHKIGSDYRLCFYEDGHTYPTIIPLPDPSKCTFIGDYYYYVKKVGESVIEYYIHICVYSSILSEEVFG